ncbi:MAG: tetratricopeptide repeat protein [Bacteroidota bacterium]|jgi:tetratricopeptide (TPR) repeat protein
MKNNLFSLFFAVLLVVFLTQGFQCGSPDFTGAKVQEQNKKFPEAAKLYEKEVQKNPTNFEAWFRLGRVRGVELNDFAGMSQAFNESEKLSNVYAKDIRALRGYYWVQFINSGVSYKNRATPDSLQYYDKAIEEYKNANMIWPDTSITYLYLAAAYQAKGDIANTVSNLTKIWEMDHDKDAFKSVGRLYIKQGLEKKEQFKTANADKLKLQKNLKEIDKGTFKSDVTQAFGTPDSQKKDKKNAKKEDWLYNQYSMTLTFDGDRVVNKKFDKTYDLNIDSTKYFEAVSEFNKAVDIFETIKAADPKDNENLNLLLQAYYEANRSVEATKAFKLAVDNDPGNKMNHYILGLLYRSVSDYDGAIAEFNEAIKIDPNFSDAFYDIGATYYNWGVKMKKASQEKGDESEEYKTKFQAALPWIEKMTEIKKDDAKIWETLGTIYALLGQADKATKALDEADRIRKAGK